MSLGLTPREFVQQVFYVQEKVLLDFFPDDDVYKEVLMEANLVLQELQKEEDWLWLRETANLGFVAGHPVFNDRPKDLHWRRFQHDFSIKVPDWVYKPSELYGDCVRLCRFRIRHEAMEPLVEQALGYKRHWQEVMDTNTIRPDHTFIYYGEVREPEADVTGFEYGGSFPFPLHDLRYRDLPSFVQRGKWYVDSDGYLFVGDKETPADDPEGIFDTETPCKIYVCDSVPVDPVKPEAPPEPLDEKFLEPAPHGYLEAWRYWHCCWLWHPYPDLPDGLVILWDPEKADIWKYVEVFENDFIRVPFASAGSMYRRNVRQTSISLQPHVPDFELGAVVVGDRLTFTRPLHPLEMHRVVLMDCQRRIEPFHICGDGCASRLGEISGRPVPPQYPDNPCEFVWEQTQRKMLTEVPDPNYVVYRTAALHAQGSPPAQGRVMDLTDTAQKLLSAMRQNNAEHTTPDYMDWQPMDFINVI